MQGAQIVNYAVLLGKGRFADEFTGFQAEGEPRRDFVELARALNADLSSYTSAAYRRGSWFRWLFEERPLWGSALDMALRISRYQRVYVTGEDIGFRLALLLKLRGVEGRIVCFVHNMTAKKLRILRMIGPKPFARLITNCSTQKQVLIDSDFPENKIVNVYHPIDDVFFSPEAASNDGPSGAFVACGAENRDYATLRSVASTVKGDVLVFGHGFFGSKMRDDVQPANWPKNFRLMPKLPFTQLRDYYARSLAVVVPLSDSLYAAGGTALLEAMAMGKTVIVSRSRGLQDYLAAEPGLTPAPGDAAALGQAMERVESGTAALKEVGVRNRRWIIENCALDTYVARVTEIMTEVD
jgi:glycosyltransferase involved in cell wall biosynthesis